MDGKKLLETMKRLREVKRPGDIPQLSNAMFPGPHCPLMGSMMAVSGITNSIMLVVGTDECTYYLRRATINGFGFGAMDSGRVFSMVLDQHDVTFGCHDKLEESVAELILEYQPELLFVVTTCVVEVIGDDVDSVMHDLEEKYAIPFIVIHTEHFKTLNHLPGVRDTITACLRLMEKTEPHGKVNIIGQRMGDFSTTELYRILNGENIELGMMLPRTCTIDSIRTAPGATVSIVLNEQGLPLAEKMLKKFAVPYVYFEKHANPEKIYRQYTELFDHLQLPLPAVISELYDRAKAALAGIGTQLQGMTYIYGNGPVECFELNALLIDLGMEPLVIHTNELPVKTAEYQQVAAHYNPFITRTANIAPLKYLIDELKPDLCIGVGGMRALIKFNIINLQFIQFMRLLGFEVTLAIAKLLLQTGEDIENQREAKRQQETPQIKETA